MRTYEVVIILKPQLSDIEIAEFLDRTKKFLAQEGGELMSEDKWGRRKLSHPIGRNRDGFYAYMKFKAPAQTISKMNQQFKVQEWVMRVIVLRGTEKEAAPKPQAPAKQAANSAGTL
ncbi:MAG: 30S ribosomal protein S6 [bacterium]